MFKKIYKGLLVSALLSSNLFAQNCFETKKNILQPGAEGKDANIFSRIDSKATNRGNDAVLESYTWTWNADGLGQGSFRSLIQFDLTSIPTGVTITSAKLILSAANHAINGSFGQNASTLHRVTTQWTESIVTWNNQPSFSTSLITSLPTSTSPDQNYILDVTRDVTDMYSNPTSNFGWLLKSNVEEIYKAMRFHSSDATTPGLRPALEISYTIPNVTSIELQPGAEGKDANIFSRSDSKATNRGNDAVLESYTWTWIADGLGQGSFRSLIQFDLSSVPSDATITSAELILKAANHAVNGSFGTNESKLHRVSSSWTESTVTWNTQPTYSQNIFVTLPTSTSATQDYTVDVTNHVKDMVSNPAANFGWMLKSSIEETYKAMRFHSSDATTSNLRPLLKIKFSCGLTTNLEEVSQNENLSVFPNPSEGIINFAFGENNWTIYDNLGEIVMTSNVNSVDISSLKAGLYTVKSGLISKKIIKK